MGQNRDLGTRGLTGGDLSRDIRRSPLWRALGSPRQNGSPAWAPARCMAEPCHVDLRRDFVGLDVGTISTIWLAWRNEARESRESALKIQQLEMQVTELRAKSFPSTRSSPSASSSE